LHSIKGVFMRDFLNDVKRGCYMPGGGGDEPEEQQQQNIPEEEK